MVTRPTTARPTWRGRPYAAWLLLGSLATLGARGVVGGAQFVLVPSGAVVGVPTTVLAPTPVDDFLLPGIFLFCVLGVAPLAVAYGLYGRRRWAWYGAVAVGLALTGWALLEGVVLGFGARLQFLNLLQGVATVVLAGLPSVREDCDEGGRGVRSRT